MTGTFASLRLMPIGAAGAPAITQQGVDVFGVEPVADGSTGLDRGLVLDGGEPRRPERWTDPSFGRLPFGSL